MNDLVKVEGMRAERVHSIDALRGFDMFWIIGGDVLASLFYTLIDIGGYRAWAIAFTVIGVNAITIYFAQRFIDFRHMSEFFLGGTAELLGSWGVVLLLAGTLLAKILFLSFLYAHRVCLRV